MKQFFHLVLIFSIIADGSHVLGSTDNELGEGSPSVGSGCPSANTSWTPKQIFVESFKCLDAVIPAIKQHLRNASTSEEVKEAIKQQCEEKLITTCMQQGRNYIAQCHGDSMNVSIAALVDTIGSAMDVLCQQDGEKVAGIYEEFLTLTAEQKDAAKYCILTIPVARQPTPDEFLELGYVMMINGRPCLKQKGEGVFSKIQDVDDIFAEIISKMQCYHPVENVIVLCESIKFDELEK